MFLRRRLFRRRAVSTFTPTLFTQRTPLAILRFVSTKQATSELSHAPSVDERATSLAASNEGPVPTPNIPLQDLKDKEVLNVIQRTVEARGGSRKGAKLDPESSYFRDSGATLTHAFLELRRRGRHSLVKTFPEVFVYIAEHSLAMNEAKTLETVVEDAVKLTRQLYGTEDMSTVSMERHYRNMKGMFGLLILRNKRTTPSLISSTQHAQLVALFETLMSDQRPSNARLQLTVSDLNVILKSIISLSSEWDHFTPVFDALFRFLRDMPAGDLVINPSLKSGKSSARVQAYTALSSTSIHLVHLLLNKGFHQLSFSFLEALVEKGVVPPQVVNNSDSELDFRGFVIAVLVRWCLHYEWVDHALEILSAEDLTNPDFQQHYASLVDDLCMSCIVASKLEQCIHIVDRIVTQSPSIKLSNSLIHTFFKTARDARAGQAASRMYAILHSTSHADHYVKGLLYGGVLQWLFAYIVHQSKNLTLGELLAQDLISSTTPINSYERGDVIASCAAGGYVTETRTLWERYAAGPEERMVTGHTKCMVDIVKLFKRMSDVNAETSRDKFNRELDMEGSKETRPGSVARKFSHTGTQSCDIDRDATRQDMVNEDNVSTVVPMAFPSNTEIREIENSAVGSNAMPGGDSLELEATRRPITDLRHGTTDTTLTSIDVEFRDRGDDSEPVSRNSIVGCPDTDEHLAFARKVLETYRRAKEPLQRASHYDLNALARASDLLGSVRQSMDALQTIVDRKEIPDTHDLNVVIIAMAARDPLRAEDMLGLMLKERMRMNALSFSAVVIGWLNKGNTIRASRVYSRAIRLGHAKLTSDAATPLLIALVDACSGAERDVPVKPRPDVWLHRTFLRQLWSLVDSEACPRSSIPSNLGERCIGAALRLKEAGLAYYFWKRFLREMAPRETDHQRELRHGIMSLVKKATKKGMVGDEEGGRMIAEMGNEAKP